MQTVLAQSKGLMEKHFFHILGLVKEKKKLEKALKREIPHFLL
jgi:hypothetical protein